MSGNEIRAEIERRVAQRKNMQSDYRQVVALEQIADDLHAIKVFMAEFVANSARR